MSDKDDLTAMFESARRAPPEPSADFLARVLSDAEAMQPAPLGVMATPTPKRGPVQHFLSGLSDAIGGWPAFAGLATAAVTGLWIGISPPQSLLDPFNAVLSGDTASLTETDDFGDGFDFTLFEG
ncbi:hypothetical protein [Planktotalea sp.]|uniref:hypothetical protein n=1 Tax=Planktotalea sp. TaxID=2029877 RepID=UPI003D6B17FA